MSLRSTIHQVVTRTVPRAWRHARHAVFAGAADWYVQRDRLDEAPALRHLFRAPLTEMVRLTYRGVSPLVSFRARLAWHRSRYAAARRGGADGLAAYEDFEIRAGPHNAALVALLLSARLPVDALVRALQSLRVDSQHCPEPLFRRALTRLLHTPDGQVAEAIGIPFVRTPWGGLHQYALGAELARWAVGRATWRRDPSVRLLVTSPSFTVPGRGAVVPAVERLLRVAAGGGRSGLYSTDDERARALVDAFSWPEFACPGTGSRDAVHRFLRFDPVPSAVLAQLTPDDLSALLSSPFPEVRTWVLTTVLSAPTARAVPAAVLPASPRDLPACALDAPGPWNPPMVPPLGPPAFPPIARRAVRRL